MVSKRKVIFNPDYDSQVFPEQLEARGIFLDGQAHVQGRVCFPTVPGLGTTPWQDTPQEKTLYHRLERLLCDHRPALTGSDPLSQESALNVLQALIHEELKKVRTQSTTRQ